MSNGNKGCFEVTTTCHFRTYICFKAWPFHIVHAKPQKNIYKRDAAFILPHEACKHDIFGKLKVVKTKNENKDSLAKEWSQCEINFCWVQKTKKYGKQNVNGYQYSCIPSCFKSIFFLQQERASEQLYMALAKTLCWWRGHWTTGGRPLPPGVSEGQRQRRPRVTPPPSAPSLSFRQRSSGKKRC